MGKLIFFVLAAALALAAASHGRWWQLPDRWNPWAPLVIAEPPNVLTRYKLHRLDAEPALCRAALAGAKVRAEPLPDRDTAAGCGFRNALRVRETQLRWAEPVSLSCRAVVSLALWEEHVVLPEARRLFGAPPERIEHFGTYACRNVEGRDVRSRHATADALDVAGFILPGGRRITVARDWQGSDAEAQFLRAVHAGACRFFDGVLGPEYNRAHADHLHLERGGFSVCR